MKMLGWYRWKGPYCSCCASPRTKGQCRAAEERKWRRAEDRDSSEIPSWPLLCRLDGGGRCWPDFCAGHDVLRDAVTTAEKSFGRFLTAGEVADVRRRVEMNLLTRRRP